MGDPIGLLQLHKTIKTVLSEGMQTTYWVVAEISEIHENYSGHCYLELIERDDKDDKLVAKGRATIWSFVFRMLKPYFETTTGTSLASGIKILVKASVEFHELYGLSLNIKDIDPTYTLGDIARKRLEIIKKLEAEGVIRMNKDLQFPFVPQRVAVISSATAAGYGDFVDQLLTNKDKYYFQVKLFQSAMQGDKAESSIIKSLEEIFEEEDSFDVVVIIRGGGSAADLSCFDSYNLAYNVAQFPIPVITGIGHERDESIVDLVAHVSVKTPTAVAEFLISKMYQAESFFNSMEDEFKSLVEQRIDNEAERLEALSMQIDRKVTNILETYKINLALTSEKLKSFSMNYLGIKEQVLSTQLKSIAAATRVLMKSQARDLVTLQSTLQGRTKVNIHKAIGKISEFDTRVRLLDPANILKRGYSITLKNGKPLKTIDDVAEGDYLSTVLPGGSVESRVVKKSKEKN